MATARRTFVGREAELACLARVLDETRSGRPGVVVIEGPAGIGKTALVHRFLDAAEELYVLHASGAAAEKGLSLGVFHQLVSFVPSEFAHAPVTALGADEGPTVPLLVGAALVDMISELQHRHTGSVVLVVDDAHWADHPSLHALVFALRRLRRDRVLTLVLAPDVLDPRLPEGLRHILMSDQATRLTLDGLGATELRALSKQLGPRLLSMRAAERLRSHTDGNPLHARALLEQLPVTAFETCDTPLPAPRSFAMLVLAQLTECPEDVRAFVEAASVLGMRCALHQAADLSEVVNPLSALDQALSIGLLVEDPTSRELTFPNSLVRAAIYQHLRPARRLALHAKAANQSPRVGTRLRHRAHAASGPDRKLALDLAELGRDNATRGDWAAAAEHLTAAARLTPVLLDQEQLSMEAVECQLLTGDALDSVAVTNRLRAYGASGWRSYVLARVALVAALIEDAHSLLKDAWRRCNPDAEATLGARIAAQLATLYVLQGRARDCAEWVDRARRLAPTPAATDTFHVVVAVGLGSSGQAEATLASLGVLPPPAIATATELDALLGRGLLRHWTDDLTGAHRDLSGVLTVSSGRSAVFRLTAADTLANVEYRLGRWHDAAAHCEVALSLAEDANQTWLAPLCHATAAVIAASRGQCEQAARHAETAQDASGRPHLLATAFGATAAAQVARSRRQPEAIVAALEPLRQLTDYDVVAEPGVVGWQDVLADALTAVGDHEQADAVLRPYEVLATQRGRRSAMAAAARARGNLEAARGNNEGAAAAFQAGLEHVKRLPMPFERARLELAHGAFLRRAGKRKWAGEQLRAARSALTRLHAHPDLERCDQELVACGLTPTPLTTINGFDLTPQETAVARLVADGLTNQQVARRLVISVKTVEYHLTHVFAKLQVTSRVQLAARFNEH